METARLEVRRQLKRARGVLDANTRCVVGLKDGNNRQALEKQMDRRRRRQRVSSVVC